jgi:F-type H+-transporting ATPase subunit delta
MTVKTPYLDTLKKNLSEKEYRRAVRDLKSELAIETKRGGACTITTATTLEEEEKTRLTKKVQEAQGEIPVKFVEDKNIIGGVIIRVGDKEIDNSIRTKLTAVLSS